MYARIVTKNYQRRWKLLLYTEEQLKYAYIDYIRKLEKNNYENKLQVKVPTLEEFRVIYEDAWEMYYDSNRS
jgi:hypothetical protein|tara:strand:+ start:578 stop:793 length:216 start_codon:yes stop_codon:yes gene_type:complete